jgi:IclR family transcriptional regulator, KDG regulon repressor
VEGATAESERAPARLVPALSRGLDVLELLRTSERPPTAGEVAAGLGLPRTTVHELLHTLSARGYVEVVEGGPRRFRLGMRLFELGNAYAAALDLARESAGVAATVRDACGETVHVAVLDGTDVVYIAKVDSTHSVRMVSAVGRRLPAHVTAVGKALLAGLDDDELERRFPSGHALPALTAASITDPAALRAALTDVRRDGLAWDAAESNPDVNCVAAPVRDHTGAMVAGLSISVPVVRWTDGSRERFAALVREGAEQLSRRLGAV